MTETKQLSMIFHTLMSAYETNRTFLPLPVSTTLQNRPHCLDYNNQIELRFSDIALLVFQVYPSVNVIQTSHTPGLEVRTSCSPGPGLAEKAVP